MRKSRVWRILLILFVMLGCVLVGQEIKQETGVALYPLCQEASKMDYFLDFKHKKVRVVFDTGKTAIPDERIELECYVWGTKIRRTAKFYDGKAVCELPMPEPGKYNLGGILRLDGNFFFDLFRMLQIPEKAPEPVFDAGNMKLTYSVDPDDMTLEVKVDASLTGVDNGKLSGEVSFAGTKAKLQFANCVGKVIVPLPKPCVPGKQDIIADLTDGNGAKVQLKSVLTIPSTEWLGNKIGLDDVVLPPWTPLRRKGSSIFCLNREYVFGKDGLPSQIVSAGKQILSAPITLKMSKDGKEVKWQPRKMRIESCTDTKAKIVGVGAANGSEIQIVTELEYDGYMYIVARPLGTGELPFDELSLELPVKRENALYRHLFSVYKVVLPKSVPEGEGIVEESPWRPFAWLGDNYRGLFWCCESDEMWPNRDGNAVQFIRDAKSVTLRLNVIKAGQKIKKDWNLAFMLMATPVKNYDARKNRKTRLYGYGKNLEFNFGPGTTVGCGFVKSDPKVDLAERVKLLQERGVRVTPYTVPTFMTYAMPESVFFKKYWWFGFDDAAILNSGWPEAWYCSSPAGKGFADFLVWHAKEYLEKNYLNGFYYDQFHPYAYAGKSAGTGYEENGVYRATYPIRAQRQLFKRLYSLVRSQPRDTWVWAHMSAKMNIAALSWNDGYFDGEHPFAALVRDKSYMEVMSLDTFRAEFIGRQWGLAPFFLPEMRGEMVKTPDATRELMAMGMVHDVPICRLWVDSYEVDRIRRELDLFDYGNSDFYAYYDDVPPASTDMKEVYVSAYKHDNGSVLFVAANLSAEKMDRTGTIRIDRKCLKVGAGKYISWPDRKPMEADGDVIKLTVPKMGYRMFVLGNPPEIELPDMPIGAD
ncbi:MAG: hypothetical protein IKS20_01125, partial [Victivallales bacterium]|nr:hypothetical protein [Victivallales bacterium]